VKRGERTYEVVHMGPYASKNLLVYLIAKTSKDLSSVIG
jgi:hypothetical protein